MDACKTATKQAKQEHACVLACACTLVMLTISPDAARHEQKLPVQENKLLLAQLKEEVPRQLQISGWVTQTEFNTKAGRKSHQEP